MKIIVQAASQEEFDSKREELIKAVAGSKFDVDIRPKGESKLAEEREPFYDAQRDILTDWNREFELMLGDIKKEIAGVIGG